MGYIHLSRIILHHFVNDLTPILVVAVYKQAYPSGSFRPIHPASANSGGDFSMWICPPIIHIFAKDGCSCHETFPTEERDLVAVNGEACRHAKRSLAQVLWYCGINQSDLTSFRTFEVANSEGMSKIRLWRQPGFVRPHSVDGSLKAKTSENFSNGYGPWVKFIGYLQTKKI